MLPDGDCVRDRCSRRISLGGKATAFKPAPLTLNCLESYYLKIKILSTAIPPAGAALARLGRAQTDTVKNVYSKGPC